MKNFLPLILAISIFVSASAIAKVVDPAQAILTQAHVALAKGNYGRAIELYDAVIRQSPDDEATALTILTARGIARALLGQMLEAEADLTGAAKVVPVPLEELKSRDPRHLVLVLQIYQWRYLTHLSLKKWKEAIGDIEAMETIGAAPNKAGTLADKGKLHLLMGQNELGLQEMGEAAKTLPAFRFEFENAQKSTAADDTKAVYLANVATQLVGSAAELKHSFQQSLRVQAAPARPAGQ